MATNMKWENPFLGTPPDHQLRTTIWIPREYQSRFKELDPQDGVLQITVSILLKKLYDELNRIGLHGYARDEYRAAVASAELHIEQRSAVVKPSPGLQHGIATEAVSGNDGRRTEPVASTVARPSESHDVPKPPSKRRNEGKKRNNG